MFLGVSWGSNPSYIPFPGNPGEANDKYIMVFFCKSFVKSSENVEDLTTRQCSWILFLMAFSVYLGVPGVEC